MILSIKKSSWGSGDLAFPFLSFHWPFPFSQPKHSLKYITLTKGKTRIEFGTQVEGDCLHLSTAQAETFLTK